MTPWNAWATALLIACCLVVAPRGHAAADTACGPNVVGSPCAAAQTAGMDSTGGVPQGAGNPVNLITGNKHQRETDMAALPGVLGLELVRHYNSRHAAPGMPLYGIGRGWQLSYDTRLYAQENSLQVVQADGARIIFARSRLRMTLCASTDPAQGVVRIDPGEATGNGLRYRWLWPEGRELGFDRNGRLARISVASGEAVVIERLHDGRIAKVTDPQGRSLTFTYPRQRDARAGRYVGIQYVDTPIGRFLYRYGDPAGGAPAQAANLVQVQMPTVLEPGVLQSLDGRDHGPSGYSRSTVRRLYHYEDPRFVSLLTGITVDGAGADGQPMRDRMASWAYDRNGLAVRADRSGEQLTFDRSAGGITRIIDMTDGRGGVTTYRHAIVGGAFRLLDARGAGCASCGQVDVRYGYDSLGRLQEVTRLDAAGQPLSGRRQELDVLGRPYALFDVAYRDGKPAGRTLTLQQLFPYPGIAYRWPGPRLPSSHYGPMRIAHASVVAGRQHERVITYNARQQPLTVAESGMDPLDGTASTRITRYRYEEINGRSLLVEVDGPLPNGPLGTPVDSDITRYDWDAHGAFVTRITQPMGATVDIDYAPYTGRMARLTYRWEDMVRQTRLDYQWDGQLARRLDIALAPDGTTELDRRNLQVTGNALGQPSQVVWPDGGIENIVRSLPPVPATQPLSGILTVQYADPLTAAAQEVLRYDVGSRSAERRFDDFGQVVAIRNPGQGWQHARYDAAGRLMEIRDPRGAVTRVRHDAAGRLLQVDRALPGDAAPQQLDFGWRGLERQSEIVRSAGRQTHAAHYRHTPWGQVSRMDVTIAGAHGGDVTLQVQSWYDPAGRLSARTLPGGERLAWRYYATAPYRGQRAAIERLHWPAMLDGLMHHVPESWLDRLGLKTRLSDFAPQEAVAQEAATLNMAVPPQPEPGLGEASGAGHDAAGLPHTVRGSQGELTLRWNAAGQLAEVQAAGKQIAHYRYDAHGRRASKHTAAGSEYYLYEGAQLLAVLQQGNKTPSSLRHYVYDGLRPVAWFKDGIAYPLQTDQRGAISAVLAPTGDTPRPLWRAGLDAWGRSQPDGPPSLDPGLRLLHQYADLETGLSYHIARYYDPTRGRFISPDAAGIPDSLGRDVPDALVLDLTAYAAGQPSLYIDPDGAARLVYYALTTDAKGKPIGVTQGFTRARWAFSVDGIEASGDGGSDAVNKLMEKYAGNQTGLLYDLKGDFLGNGKSVASWTGASDETVDSFKKHYQSSLITMPQFVIADYSNKDAALLIAALTKDKDGDNLCHDTPGLLPQIRFGAGEDRLVVTSARGVDASSPANLQRLVNCQVNTTTAFPVSYADDTERERVERIEAAAEMNETSALNKDCSTNGCPGVTITGQPGPNNAPAREYHASYGRSQFVAATFIETLDNLPQEDKTAIGLTADLQRRITDARARAVSVGIKNGLFDSVRKYACDKAASAWDNAGQPGEMTKNERTTFKDESGLDRQSFIDMACFVPEGNSKPLGEGRNAFVTESIFTDTVLKTWLMDLYKSYDAFNLVSRIFIRNNLRKILADSNLKERFKNEEISKSVPKTRNTAIEVRQRQIEDELAMRTARLHNGGPDTARATDIQALTRTCTSNKKILCDIGNYVKTFSGVDAGRGDWRSLRCGEINKNRGIQLLPLKII